MISFQEQDFLLLEAWAFQVVPIHGPANQSPQHPQADSRYIALRLQPGTSSSLAASNRLRKVSFPSIERKIRCSLCRKLSVSV